MATLGKRIRELRTERHVTQEQLASVIGVAKNTISVYENDQRRPSYTVLEAICDFFNVDVDYLLGREDVSTRLLTQDELRLVDRYRAGLKTSWPVTEQEMDIIDAYRDASPDTQRAVRAILNVQERAHPVVYYTNVETANAAQEMFEKHRILFDAAKDAPPESIRQAADLLNKFKETNPDG